ncbi:MAG: ATP-dependent dethiobiotin synthetase BioD [Planctomycetota bacterium]
MARAQGDVTFVAGTDTGVGKTLFTAAFTLVERWKGRSAAGFKGAASDCVDIARAGGQAPARLNEDILLLALCNAWPLGEAEWAPTGGIETWLEGVAAVAPLRFLLPAAPTVAARAERTFVDVVALTRALEALAGACALGGGQGGGRVFYEGIGGLMVPLNDSTLSIDHARRVSDRCRLVARTTLGTINHTALSVLALQSRRMNLEALYLTHAEERPLSAVEAANAGEIARVTKVPMHSILTVEYLPETLPAGPGKPGRPGRPGRLKLPAALLGALPPARAAVLEANWARALRLARWLAQG